MAQMALPGGLAPMPILTASKPPARKGRGWRLRDRHGGFSMLEIVMAMVVLGLLATLGLPFVRAQRGTAALQAEALRMAALLRADRNAAIASGITQTVLVDPQAGRLRSARTSGEIVLPQEMSLRLSGAGAGFRFYPDGRASGGQLIIRSGLQTVEIDISGPTALIRILEATDDRR